MLKDTGDIWGERSCWCTRLYLFTFILKVSVIHDVEIVLREETLWYVSAAEWTFAQQQMKK